MIQLMELELQSHVCEILLSEATTIQETCKEEKISRKIHLSLDKDASWNATYLMLDNAIIFEKAFARLNKENKYF